MSIFKKRQMTKKTISRAKLESYRDLLINQDELTDCGRVNMWSVRPEPNEPVRVCAEHVLKALRATRDRQTTHEDLVTWQYTIQFTDYLFDICEEQRDSIAGVFVNAQYRAGVTLEGGGERKRES